MLNIQLATKYARAIFELAQEENNLDGYDSDLSKIREDVFAMPEAVKFFQNPLVPHKAKKICSGRRSTAKFPIPP